MSLVLRKMTCNEKWPAISLQHKPFLCKNSCSWNIFIKKAMKKSLNHSKKYAIFDFIKKSAASNVDKEAIKTFIATFRAKTYCKQKISIWQGLLSTYHHNKWSQNIRRSAYSFTRWKNSVFHKVTIRIKFQQTKTQSVISQ